MDSSAMASRSPGPSRTRQAPIPTAAELERRLLAKAR